MDPVKTDNPTLHSVMTELTSAQSSINMPTPLTATGRDVEHAYMHIEEAMRQLAVLMMEAPSVQKPDMGATGSVVEIDFVVLCQEEGIDVITCMTQSRVHHLASIREDIQRKLDAQFLSAPNTEDTRRAIKNVARGMLSSLIQTGKIL